MNPLDTPLCLLQEKNVSPKNLNKITAIKANKKPFNGTQILSSIHCIPPHIAKAGLAFGVSAFYGACLFVIR